MEEVVQEVIETVNESKLAFCKFISANDAGKTGGHQAGFYMPKTTIPLMFDSPGIKGENKDRFITIRWHKDFSTDSRFTYYGKGTRDEYRLTRFGRGFPFLSDDNVGDLFVLAHIGDDYYEGFVLSNDEDIENFLTAFNISPTETNDLIDKVGELAESNISTCFRNYIKSLQQDFPPTLDMALNARKCYNSVNRITEKLVRRRSDELIIAWIEAEYELFKELENTRYGHIIKTPFQTVEELVQVANTILNRRKSRAGKSLEHHLAEIFVAHQFEFETQVRTEGNKKPDFLFPGQDSYHDKNFDEKKLILLAAKTTCKDRWRQILNEADRIETKHLFTLQQGISSNQLTEMQRYNVQLVVPKKYKKAFPEKFQDNILSLADFIQYINKVQK